MPSSLRSVTRSASAPSSPPSSVTSARPSFGPEPLSEGHNPWLRALTPVCRYDSSKIVYSARNKLSAADVIAADVEVNMEGDDQMVCSFAGGDAGGGKGMKITLKTTSCLDFGTFLEEKDTNDDPSRSHLQVRRMGTS